MPTSSQKGVTLIELMIVVSILAILAAIAYPSYTSYVQRSRRAEAKTVVLDLAMRQERWRASDTDYGTLPEIAGLSPPITGANPSDTYYTYTVANAANTYTITATPQGGQAADGCTLTVDQSGTKLPANCW